MVCAYDWLTITYPIYLYWYWSKLTIRSDLCLSFRELWRIIGPVLKPMGGGWDRMPLYEYECEACGLRFERVQHFSDDPLRTCPECEGPVHRVIHPVSIIFKGSGFYVTDSRSKSPTLGNNGKARDSRGPETHSEAATAREGSEGGGS